MLDPNLVDGPELVLGDSLSCLYPIAPAPRRRPTPHATRPSPRAVRSVAAGETFFPPNIADRLDQRTNRPALTDRELEVLQLIVDGYNNKEIAARLGVKLVTVKVHVSHIFEKLDVQDRTQAATAAIQRGYAHLDH